MTTPPPPTPGQGAVVTGAVGGIGKALAQRLISEGIRVVVNDADVSGTMATAAEIGAHGIPGDAASVKGAAALVEAAREHLGGIDLWFGNAGIFRGEGLVCGEADWAASWEVNTMAHVRAARLLVPTWVVQGGGRFVITASAAGLLTALGTPTYSVTKHSAVAFAEWLSATYRHRGVAVHAICPQGVQTAMLDQSGALHELLISDGALTPEQVADATWQAMVDETFLVLPHATVSTYYTRRASDPDHWLGAMNTVQQHIEAQQQIEEKEIV